MSDVHRRGRLCLDSNRGPIVAVGDRVLHHVVEHARHLIAVDKRHEPLGDVHDGALALIGELGIELLRDLAEHEPEIDVAARQDDVMEVEARDVEELLDKAVEAVRLLQGHAREAHPLLLGKIGGLVQQREGSPRRSRAAS